MSNVNQIFDDDDWRICWDSFTGEFFEVDNVGTICGGGESNRFDEVAKRKRGCCCDWLNNGVEDVDGKNKFELNVLFVDEKIIGGL